MLKLVYSADGKAYSDFGLVEEAGNVLAAYIEHKKHHDGDFTVAFCTENFVTAMRVVLMRAGFDPSDVVFVFGSEVITLDDSYQISHWPDGFCDNELNHMREITNYVLSQGRQANAENN